ncbi:hypothetical protein ABB37_08171 [Leptomonas pyrrhocoris]|uniref:Transmembrane protein n=1 Tax=Leptomonas pyrrhocoris TaxID=157538 RepID=A0A0M9FU71_LEPPY|nr:hypothetical protein ABB37_08171 [Leptomonas pyrrhocoris]KPA76029.1 hypothetical protein ABB37_08171 [Leptomonas pyrrhocoris]|eukprot:XP_015654468.1 hypothetical protein ABB37_08171 [Leptomonas pyrrhocoris]
MFFDLLDMTLSYIQYLALLLRLDPSTVPNFYTKPFKVLRYAALDVFSDVNEGQRYHNYLRVSLPAWLPLDIRLQYVCVAVIGPMVVSTFGMLFVYGKLAYIWFVCVLATLFMFLYGFILLANQSSFAVPGAVLPARSSLGVLGGVGLPCFLCLLAGGLLGMGRARLQLLRQDAIEMERMVEEERQRRRGQRVTQQMVDREGIDLVAVAAEQVHAQRDKDAMEHIDWGDVVLQGLFVVVLFIGSLVLLNAIKIPAIADIQSSAVFTALGAVGMVVWGCVAFWWVLDFFKKGRQLQFAISDFVSRRCLGLIVTVCNLLYINVVINFISIVYCVTLTCAAGTRTPFSASLFPAMTGTAGAPADVLAGSTVGCLACNYHAHPQRCSADWQQQLCSSAVQQRRLVYDLRVPYADIDALYKVSGSLIFAVYLLFVPYLQFYMAQYTVRVLKESFPLERRYYDVFTPDEIYFQKVLVSQNNAAFAYRAYKPQFRFYRLSFLLQKVILGVVGCVMRKGLNHDVAWAGMVFFIVVPLIALSCALYLRPFSRQVEAYYFIAVQAMVSLCAIVCLAAQQIRETGMPSAVWIVLLVLLILVPVCVLVVGNAMTLREERRWTELWQRRLVEGVTAAYDDDGDTTHRLNPLRGPPQPNTDACATDCTQRSGTRRDDKGENSSSSSSSSRSRTSSSSCSDSSTSSSNSGEVGNEGGGVQLSAREREAHGQREEGEDVAANATPPKAFICPLTPSYETTSAPASASSPPSPSRHRGPSSALSDSPSTPRTAAPMAISRLRLLRALPGLLQTDSWVDWLKTVLELARRTVAAPFSHSHQRGEVEDSPCAGVPSQGQSAAAQDNNGAAARTGNTHSSTNEKETCGQRGTKAKYSGSSDESGFVEECREMRLRHRNGHRVRGAADRRSPAETAEMESARLLTGACSGGNSPHSASDAGDIVPTSQQPRRRHPSSSLPSASLSLSQLYNCLPVARPPSGARPHSRRVSTSLSPGNSMLSSTLRRLDRGNTPTLTTPPACVRVRSARELTSPQHQGQQQQQQQRGDPLHDASDTNRGGPPPASREACANASSPTHAGASNAAPAEAAASAGAGEYADDATTTFIPALYFSERARGRQQRLQHTDTHPRQGSASLTSTSGHVHRGTRGNPLTRRKRSSASTTQELGVVRLPWQRQEEDAPPPQPIGSALSTQSAGCGASPPQAETPEDGAASRLVSTSGNDVAVMSAVASASISSSVRSAWRAAWKWILSADDDAARRRRNVLCFADVYVRRQLCGQATAAAQREQGNAGGIAGDDTPALTAAQLRHCARRAFWGCPTDAMLGVVEVPGSMPPWGLYCHAPVPSSSVHAATAAEGEQTRLPSHRSMFSLQRQYYAQLAEEQQQQQAAGQRGSPVPDGNTDGTSLTNSPAYTSLSQSTSFRLAQPMHPLRAAAYERQFAAARAYRRERADSLLPLDTELDTYANALSDDDDDEKGKENDGNADERSSGGGVAGLRNTSGTLHWLQRWGPVLTELLYEAATDDQQWAMSPRAAAQLRDSASDDEGRQSPAHSSSSLSPRSSLSSPPLSSLPSSAGSSRHRHRHGTSKATKKPPSWLRWLPVVRWIPAKKKKRVRKTQQPGGRFVNDNDEEAAAAAPSMPDFTSDSPLSHVARTLSKRGETSCGVSSSAAAPSLRRGDSLHSLRRHQSTLLTLITGTQTTRAPSVRSEDEVTALLADPPRFDGKEGSDTASLHNNRERSVVDRRVAPVDSLDALSLAPALSDHWIDSSMEQPPDPLIQQLRCLHLVRQRLKESYWEHRNQLTAVQDYIDYEINETMQRVLTFLFIVVGTVATVSFALAILGMMHTLDWRFINGVRRTEEDVRYELAGYTSWANFTEHCCCVAATDVEAQYPFFALDVENWICANGVTKERVRRDGYDGVVEDGYAVRALCGMEFENGCSVTVDSAAQTATLTGCSATAVTAAAMQRW